MGNAGSNRQNLSLPPPLPLPRRYRARRSPAIFMAAPPLTVSTKCWRRLSPSYSRKHPETADDGRSPDAEEFMRVLTFPKRVLTPSVAGVRWQLHTANGGAWHVTFGFGLGTS